MMLRKSTIELAKESMKFSAGHFTVFSKEIRENLHGHNYNVYAAITTIVDDVGLSFDYRFYKTKLLNLCSSLNETVIIPKLCKYLSIHSSDKYVHVNFNNEEMLFLKRDVTLLNISNVTVEELSFWILEEIKKDKKELEANRISALTIKVFSGPGKSGSASWEQV